MSGELRAAPPAGHSAGQLAGQPDRRRALVVFSGGQDSTTCLYWAKKRFDHVEAITFDYGQRHAVELECSKHICDRARVPQKIVRMDFLAQLAPSALTDASREVSETGGLHNLPSTFVPGRNIFFLTMAATYAVPRGTLDIVAGVCETDFSGYPDCRETFVASMERSLTEGLGSPVVIHRPLMFVNKAETFALAQSLGCLGEVIQESHTCYQGNRTALHAWGYGCGECPACKLRAAGFAEFLKESKSHGEG